MGMVKCLKLMELFIRGIGEKGINMVLENLGRQMEKL
eukprot:CAMPEP_0204821174 /NCGR_PEP_ID=MMETSP1018-20131115/4213_1 /ASSEMBLY_ACC=CAM_ASM_000518 /TAXON_ID=46462 /ORGANISM="Anophryoides haemophila, Strain AH6" /LENGTH=36 /DNA_ID= /DNA_START= /DNA_END= /DNA_ORIENTATION=